jgi:hypothetical protein
MPQTDFSAPALTDRLTKLLSDPAALSRAAQDARLVAMAQEGVGAGAAEALADVVAELAARNAQLDSVRS